MPHLRPVLPLPETVRQLHLRQGTVTTARGQNVPDGCCARRYRKMPIESPIRQNTVFKWEASYSVLLSTGNKCLFFWVCVLLMHPGRLVFFRRGALNTSSWAVFDSELKSTWSHCQAVGDSSLNTSNNTPWADNHPGGAPGRDSGTSCDFCSPPPCLAYRLWTASHAQSEPELFYTEVFHSWGGYVSSHLEVKYF